MSTSYVQSNRHAQVSENFHPIQASAVGDAIKQRGFDLVGLKTGKGRLVANQDFQRTVSRFRALEAIPGLNGLSLDILYQSKHMGRGADEFRLGFFRDACANQWNMGVLFASIKIKHNDGATLAIEQALESIMAQRAKLVDSIKHMQATTLSADDIDQLAKQYADIRLAGRGDDIVSVDYRVLGTVNRAEDAKTDLFTVANVLQENAIRNTLTYRVNDVDTNGAKVVNIKKTRPMRENSTALVDINGKFFDAALNVVALNMAA